MVLRVDSPKINCRASALDSQYKDADHRIRTSRWSSWQDMPWGFEFLGRADPDQTARAYLKAIAGDPEAVQRALQLGP